MFNFFHYFDTIYSSTALWLTSGGNSTAHTHKNNTHNNTNNIENTNNNRMTHITNWEEYGPFPVFASFTLAFALQLRKRHGISSVRVAEECQYTYYQSIHITNPTHTHNNTLKAI